MKKKAAERHWGKFKAFKGLGEEDFSFLFGEEDQVGHLRVKACQPFFVTRLSVPVGLRIPGRMSYILQGAVDIKSFPWPKRGMEGAEQNRI